ncbi:MAG: PIN domain-containing protein [Planctomycetota bacterium]|nr:PIN domain-containing protein [Planctomycetota bacterium]
MDAVDTNVLVYFVDVDEPEKRAKAIELLERLETEANDTVLPWQVGVEFLSVLRRWETEGRIPRDQTVLHVQTIESMFSVVFPARSLLSASLDLSSRYSLSHWDSLLIVACIDAGIDTLYTEDLDDGMNYDGVTVINPFA